MDTSPPPLAPVKRCCRCYEEKPLGDFWVDRNSRDGRRSTCKVCASEAFQELKIKRNKRCPECDALVSPYRTYCRRCHARQERSWRWQGGRSVDRKGYIVLSGHQDHPNARVGGSIFEHVLVMTQVLQRPLIKGESVHHKNGVKDDNRPENLELWSRSHPVGQRVTDKIAWAQEFLAFYGPSSPSLF